MSDIDPQPGNSPFAVSATARRFVLGELARRWRLVLGILVGGAVNAGLVGLSPN